MKFLLSWALVALSCTALFAQAPEVDTAEVARRGDMVVVAGEGPRSGSEDLFISMVSPPKSDSDRWFVTVITTPNCPYCERLKSDFRKAPELTALTAAVDPAKAWAHYNEYSTDDATQRYRVALYKTNSYPLIVVQPPRNGSYGDASTVVFQQAGYDGNPAKLAKAINSALKGYAAKLAETKQSNQFAQQGARQVAPPFAEPQQSQPYNPVVQQIPPQIPPQADGSPSLLAILNYLISGGNLFLGSIMLVGAGVYFVRQWRVSHQQKMLLTDAQYKAAEGLSNGLSGEDLQNVLAVLKELAQKKKAS